MGVQPNKSLGAHCCGKMRFALRYYSGNHLEYFFSWLLYSPGQMVIKISDG